MIAIVDYGMGNLRSVEKALHHVGGDARVIQSPGDMVGAEKIVLPGVGAFRDAIARLYEFGLAEPIVRAIRDGVPFLGICLGLQMLFDISYEDGEYNGLGVFPGKVVRFDFDAARLGVRLAVPQIGWNRINWNRPCPLFEGIENGSYVYFVHSYHVVPTEADVTAATTDYGYTFTSAVWKGNVFATQFHPEKSQSVGLKILENFVKL